MLKKHLKFLAYISLYAIVNFVFILFNIKGPGFDHFVQKYKVENGKNQFTWDMKKYIQDTMKQKVNKLKDNDETKDLPDINAAPAVSEVALKLCPDTPPQLVGPILVEFSTKRTLDKLRKKFQGFLQEGGRYKPTECISKQKVAIIIPFRNRYEHLTHWLYYLHPILKRQQLDYGVYVINQDGDGIFNRATLMNVGFVEAQKFDSYDCFVFSDVDLIPMDDRNLYRCFDNPRHLTSAIDKFGFRLSYQNSFGGVTSLSKAQFMKVNGYSNMYWGWGQEDDDLFQRVTYRGMSVSRPNSTIGKYRMIKHSRDLHNEPNPKNPSLLQHTHMKMDTDGINSLSYNVKKIDLDILYTFITVDIHAPESGGNSNH